MSNRTLRVLIVEDSPDDAYLVERQLRRHGFAPECLRVENAAQMQQALQNGVWDLIISDYLLPEFNALGAIKLYREAGLDVPFLVVSGSIGEDVAVEAMRNGVHDYMMKDSMARLGVAVDRELREADNRAERRRLAEGMSLRLRALLTEIRSAADLATVHRTAEQALRLIDELDSTRASGSAAR